MKTFTLTKLFLIFVLAAYSQDYKQLIFEGTHTVETVKNSAEIYFDSVGRGRGTGYKPYRRWLYMAERSMDETGLLKSPEFYYNELINYNSQVNAEGIASRATVGSWEDMGPTYWNATSGYNPGVGRATSVSVEEGNLNHIIAGSDTGGVWKSLDGGSTWQVLTDNLANIDVFTLTIDPTNNLHYYWGSTSGVIFKSVDGGATWNFHSDVGSGIVNKILVDPTNSLKVYASAQGGGLFKSTDGGLTWTRINSNALTGHDFEFKPGDPTVIYASGNSFYKSTDGGATFSIDNSFSNGAKMIGVSPDNPSVVYVLEADGNLFGGLYKSLNDGISFSELDHTGKNYFGYDTFGFDNRGQAPRDMDIVVHPEDINDVHIAGINSWRSTDGGVSFTITSQWTPNSASALNIGYCHADIDIMLFAQDGDPSNPTTHLFLGTDGGVFRADNPTNVRSNYYTDLSVGMGIRQFYKIGISQTDPVVVTGGSQDNGSSALGANGLWTDWWGADGMEGFIDKDDSQIMYGTSQFGSFVKTFNGGLNISGVSQPDGKGGTFTWNWIVPYEQDPSVTNRIYCAFDEVYQSENGGGSWTSISQNFGANIDHFKVAPSNNDIKYLAINGMFYTSLFNSISWTQSSLNLNGGFITEIAVHPSNPAKVAIASTDSGKVYISNDFGASWTSIAWDLPNFIAQALAWHDNGQDGLYVGMNYGVYYTDNELGNTWIPFSNGLPNVRINELEINTADDKLYAGTFGRGLWRTNLYDASLSLSDVQLDEFLVYPNPASTAINLKWNRSEMVSVRVFNALGRLVHYDKDVDLLNTYQINAAELQSGIYFVKINSALGEMTRKVIIE